MTQMNDDNLAFVHVKFFILNEGYNRDLLKKKRIYGLISLFYILFHHSCDFS